jgi:hypothetical protein
MGVSGGLMSQLLAPRGEFAGNLGGHVVVDLTI